ncbi:MAG TPA: DNA translocase FtsK [Bacillales bacterium]|nr:DNA translocase FtsK [Bacillales bacterium]
MAKRKKRKKKQSWSRQFAFEVLGLALFAISVLALAKLGAAGRAVYQFFRFFGGNWSIIFLVGLFLLSLYLIWKREKPDFWTRRLTGCYLFVFAMLLLSHVQLFVNLTADGQWENSSVISSTWHLYWEQLNGNIATKDLGGGMIGAVGFAFCYVLFSAKGTQLVAFILMIMAFILITGKSLGGFLSSATSSVAAFVKNQADQLRRELADWRSEVKTKREQQQQQKRQKRKKASQNQSSKPDGTTQQQSTPKPAEEEQQVIEPIIHDFSEYEPQSAALSKREEPAKAEMSTKEEPLKNAPSFTTSEPENKDYQLPGLDLLLSSKKNNQNVQKEYIHENARKLERTFESFGVHARIRKVHVGPAVTKYEVYPDVGVKVSKILSLNDDLALALAAKEIRIEAPIPGKSAVGIEVPNQEVSMVTLREVLEAREGNQKASKLAIGLGRDISGNPVLADLASMPHLLVAGSTGSGKSVCINSMIISILTWAKPHEVKMIMIDPKMVELNVYNGVPHLLTPVVTDPKKASQALRKVVDEMERRYELFSDSGTKNIESYNNWLRRQNDGAEEPQALMPYVVVLIDELADLMMVASKDVEDSIMRLAQMARAAGIHLIIATQRPSVDVITGVIKANIPSRIAFNVSSQTDSRTILDMGGADKLLGQGDMLFLPVGASKPTRIQGAFLSDDEVEHIVDYVIGQQKAQYQEEMIPNEEPEQAAQVEDEHYEEAVRLVAELGSASVSMLQRRFRIGYTRAARLIDAMEANGIVGPYEGSKPRKVLISKANDEAAN